VLSEHLALEGFETKIVLRTCSGFLARCGVYQCQSDGDNCKSCNQDQGEPHTLFQFAQVSDIHIGKSPPQQENNLAHAVSQINQMEVAFVFVTGTSPTAAA